MMIKKFAVAGLVALLTTGVAVGQTTQTPPATKAPATTAPATTAAMKPGVSTTPAGTKVNLNTATEAQLDALPSIGKARAKVIMTERAKAPFKDWNDFDTRMAHT